MAIMGHQKGLENGRKSVKSQGKIRNGDRVATLHSLKLSKIRQQLSKN